MSKLINSNVVYRSWDDIIGNEDAKEAAMEAATSAAVFRLLIKGAVGTGKTTLANMLTRRWLCDQPNGYEPCWAVLGAVITIFLMARVRYTCKRSGDFRAILEVMTIST